MRKREMCGKVVVFGGTSEGRRLAEAFWGSGLSLHICVATEYGAGLLPHGGNVHIHTGRMGAEEMERFLGEEAFDLCLGCHASACGAGDEKRAGRLQPSGPSLHPDPKGWWEAGEWNAG